MNNCKKIGTLTFHIAHNYGAMLQAHALQQAITQLGAACEIIDYRFPYIDQWSGIRTFRELCQESGWVWGTLRFLKRWCKRYYRHQSPMRRKFNDFMRRMRLSRKIYFNKEQLLQADYDCIVTGSDQIWNPDLTNGPAREYFGQCFNLTRCKLISYAASNGKNTLPAEYASQMQQWLQSYSALGIREKGLAESLNTCFHLPATAVLDPVFLMPPAEWSRLSKRASVHISEPYLLLYAFQVGDEIYQMARNIAQERKLRLVTIQYKRDDALDDMLQLTDCGPEDFVSLIQHADFICTSSFHGNAFAIIFEKDFYCIGHPLYSQRNRDMLELLGLSHRFVSNGSDTNHSIPIDYSACRKILQAEIERSRTFLEESL